MQRSMIRNAWRGLFVLAVVLATASVSTAQSIIDGRRVEFTPSANHDAVDPATGAAIVQSYSMQLFVAGSATPVQTLYLGKPTPEADGMIRLDFVSLLSTPLTPGVIYEAVVEAIGQVGTGVSARSNTFAFSGACTPTISPSSQSIAAAGGTGSTTVSAGTGCSWTASSNSAWITVTAGASRIRIRYRHVQQRDQHRNNEPHRDPDDRGIDVHGHAAGRCAVQPDDFTRIGERDGRGRHGHRRGDRDNRLCVDRQE